MTKLCLLILINILLAGCAPEAPRRVSAATEPTETQEDRIRRLGLRWHYATQDDDMTSGMIRRATVSSLNEVEFGFPYQGAQRAELELRTHPRYGKDVILSVDRGQFLCQLDGCSVMVRYDDGRSWEYPALEPASHSSTALFIQGYADVLHSLKSASKVRIEAKFYQQAPQVFEFDVSGLDWPRGK